MRADEDDLNMSHFKAKLVEEKRRINNKFKKVNELDNVRASSIQYIDDPSIRTINNRTKSSVTLLYAYGYQFSAGNQIASRFLKLKSFR